MLKILPSASTEMKKKPLEVFRKKGVLRNFTKFTGKHLYQSLFFNRVADLGPAALLKKGLLHRCFPVNLAKFLRTPFFRNTSRRLLLEMKDLLVEDITSSHGLGNRTIYFKKEAYFLTEHAVLLCYISRSLYFLTNLINSLVYTE